MTCYLYITWALMGLKKVRRLRPCHRKIPIQVMQKIAKVRKVKQKILPMLQIARERIKQDRTVQILMVAIQKTAITNHPIHQTVITNLRIATISPKTRNINN